MVSEEQNSDMELASEVVPVPQVQPEVEATEEDQNAPNQETNDVPRPRQRQRKKALHAAIIKQMEFYFGDSNLSKDRFLAGLIKENPDVDLDIFLRFNRIRALTTDKSRIAKALRYSTMLKVSEDGEKVRRITPIVEKQNVDECTIYVQRLPSDADHEWLSKIFSEYGPVAYVSIPKFKYNNKIKGFAFVEFETPEAAAKCLKAFRKKGCELPSQTSPSEVLSITTFNEQEIQKNDENTEKSEVKKSDKNVNDGSEENGGKSSESDKPIKRIKGRKRSFRSEDPGDSGTDQSDASKSKKKKGSDNTDKDSNACPSDSSTGEEKHAKRRKNRHSLEVHDSDAETQKNVKEGDKKQKKVKTEVPDEETESDNHGQSSACRSDSNTEGEEKHVKKRKNRHSLEVHDSDAETQKNVKEGDKKQKKVKTEMPDEETESDNHAQSSACPSDSNTEGEEKRAKKRKNRHSLEEAHDSDDAQKNSKESEKKQKKVKIEKSEEVESESCVNQKTENNEENISDKKKKLKRKRKRHNSTGHVQTVNMGLQIMAKKDWKKLRNKYLDLQRAKMKQLKQHIKKARWNQWGDKNKIEAEHEETSNKKGNPASILEFKPGVIVKFELNEACVDPKGFKAELKNKNSNIKYIDIKEGSNEGFIRCDSSEAAAALAEKPDKERHYKVLSAEEEKAYWDKIERDREQKIGNKIRVKQRGREKLLKKAEKELGKHIKFDEV